MWGVGAAGEEPLCMTTYLRACNMCVCMYSMTQGPPSAGLFMFIGIVLGRFVSRHYRHRCTSYAGRYPNQNPTRLCIDGSVALRLSLFFFYSPFLLFLNQKKKKDQEAIIRISNRTINTNPMLQ